MTNKKLVKTIEWLARIQGVLIIGLYLVVKGTYIIFTMMAPPDSEDILQPYRYLGILLVVVVIGLNLYIQSRIKKNRATLLQRIGE